MFSGCDILLCLDYIRAIGSVSIKSDGSISLLKELLSVAASCISKVIENDDFSPSFDGLKWSVKWKWKENVEPSLSNKFVQYPVKSNLQKEFIILGSTNFVCLDSKLK